MSYDGLNISIHFTILYSVAFPGNTKHLSNFLYNVCPTSSTLVQPCTNVIQMFCVYWFGGRHSVYRAVSHVTGTYTYPQRLYLQTNHAINHPATLTICYLEIVGHGPTRLQGIV